jgi:hypothetical protein
MDEINGITGTSASPLDQLIERWWQDHFPGSAVARDTTAWNAAHAAKETLKRLLGRAERPPSPKTGDEDQKGST